MKLLLVRQDEKPIVPFVSSFTTRLFRQVGTLPLVSAIPHKCGRDVLERRTPGSQCKSVGLKKGNARTPQEFYWWAILDSNQRPPRCQRDALPTTVFLIIQKFARFSSVIFIELKKLFLFAGQNALHAWPHRARMHRSIGQIHGTHTSQINKMRKKEFFLSFRHFVLSCPTACRMGFLLLLFIFGQNT